ncbi:PQQ-dependent sugar dehydrogenase [Teredinibacter sp. KSP-S5-2]|uniref:PQQ-dependent sugar dehydrogenase n=1 Tax=Teredinibacter sp. KSP-S5-2 TaxID=3034506 RepID=UPI002934818D|nr:PQQ-dependent sugar dehydrogenase [Teredinibacter sp. KSP-S5-2]WNO10889.1 PQQ-dependent sugar dehydrogenase [Teredinibacter sp. KSP-S5-2]
MSIVRRVLLSFSFLIASISYADVTNIYQTHCSGCHGKNLSGGSGSSLIDNEWKYGGRDEDIAQVIKYGAPDMGMPAWGKILTDEDVRSLVILIREETKAASLTQMQAELAPENGVIEASGHKYSLTTLAELNGVLWGMAFLPDGSILVTERSGSLWQISDKKKRKIIDVADVWQHGQGGLLDVYLHPDYLNNGWIYMSYSHSVEPKLFGRDKGITKIIRGKIRNGQWQDQQTIFELDDKFHTSAGVHFGSRLAIIDGYLFFSIGDRGDMALAQQLDKPNGKIFRVHDDGRVPKDNPFVDQKGALPEIWSYGHRNPQGMTVARDGKTLWITEHGPRGGDEINIVEKGKNYGWPVVTHGMNYNGTPMTAHTSKPGMVDPLHYWVPSIAVSDIDFYSGEAFPLWKNRLLVSGMASEELHLLDVKGNSIEEDRIILKNRGRIRDVAVGPKGVIYLLLNNRGSKTGKLVTMNPVK